jgi:hypothetical protein
MVQATQLLARYLATKDYKTRHSLKMMSPIEYRKFRKAEPSDRRRLCSHSWKSALPRCGPWQSRH